MTNQPSLTFRHHGLAEARRIRSAVEMIYQDAYVEAIGRGDPFSSPTAFMHRFDTYTKEGGFELVVACADGEPVGQSWGWPLATDTTWWDGLVAEPEPGFTAEDGQRTFALSEIMVRQGWAGRGIAHALHDDLLRGRREERATLLVRPTNTFAYRAYTRWGWQQVAQLRPGWPDAPLFDVLILPLPMR